MLHCILVVFYGDEFPPGKSLYFGTLGRSNMCWIAMVYRKFSIVIQIHLIHIDDTYVIRGVFTYTILCSKFIPSDDRKLEEFPRNYYHFDEYQRK